MSKTTDVFLETQIVYLLRAPWCSVCFLVRFVFFIVLIFCVVFLFCLFSCYALCLMLPVSLDCLLVAPYVFSNVYLEFVNISPVPADDGWIQYCVTNLKYPSYLLWFSPGTHVSSSNKTDPHNITIKYYILTLNTY